MVTVQGTDQTNQVTTVTTQQPLQPQQTQPAQYRLVTQNDLDASTQQGETFTSLDT